MSGTVGDCGTGRDCAGRRDERARRECGVCLELDPGLYPQHVIEQALLALSDDIAFELRGAQPAFTVRLWRRAAAGVTASPADGDDAGSTESAAESMAEGDSAGLRERFRRQLAVASVNDHAAGRWAGLRRLFAATALSVTQEGTAALRRLAEELRLSEPDRGPTPAPPPEGAPGDASGNAASCRTGGDRPSGDPDDPEVLRARVEVDPVSGEVKAAFDHCRYLLPRLYLALQTLEGVMDVSLDYGSRGHLLLRGRLADGADAAAVRRCILDTARRLAADGDPMYWPGSVPGEGAGR